MIKRFLTKKERSEVEKRIESFNLSNPIRLSFVIANASNNYVNTSLRLAIYFSIFFSLLSTYFIKFQLDYLYILLPFLLVIFFLPLTKIKYIKKLGLIEQEVHYKVFYSALNAFHAIDSDKHDTKSRVLIYLSLFEKRIELIFGSQINPRLKDSDKEKLLRILTEHFKEKEFYSALLEFIDELENIVQNDNTPLKISESSEQSVHSEIHWI